MANILIAAVKYPVASGRYMTDAFRRLGHTVYVLGPSTGNKVWGLELNPKYIWDESGIPAGWKPDLCITMDTNYNPILQYDCPHVIYTVDSHVRNVADKTAYPAKYDHYFLAHHEGPAMKVCDCYDAPCTWLPCAYDPTIFTPSPIPMSRRRYDVALVGVPYERRVKLTNMMIDAGLEVHASLGPLYDEYRDIYHNSRISLCVSIAGDVAQRVFETAAMGCVILTDPLHDAQRLGLQQANTTSGTGTVNCLVYDNDEEAVEIALSYCQNPNAPFLDILPVFSKQWARPHTWDARAETILKTMRIS